LHHPAALGHRTIALSTRTTDLVPAGYGPAHRAKEGFAEAVRQRGLTGVDVPCGDDPAAGEECFEQLRERHPEVTAITTVNEAALPGLQRGIERAGVAVPRELSIAGVAARHWAEGFRPQLTAADVPTLEMGGQAVDLLLERIAAPDNPPRHLLLTPPISLRDSTGPAPAR
jgi:DNA-binding LacI/PurR family transcriptional regulator